MILPTLIVGTKTTENQFQMNLTKWINSKTIWLYDICLFYSGYSYIIWYFLNKDNCRYKDIGNNKYELCAYMGCYASWQEFGSFEYSIKQNT